MEGYRFIYRDVVHVESGGGCVAFRLERPEGGPPFYVELSVQDAKRLIPDLQEQVRIASFGN